MGGMVRARTLGGAANDPGCDQNARARLRQRSRRDVLAEDAGIGVEPRAVAPPFGFHMPRARHQDVRALGQLAVGQRQRPCQHELEGGERERGDPSEHYMNYATEEPGEPVVSSTFQRLQSFTRALLLSLCCFDTFPFVQHG